MKGVDKIISCLEAIEAKVDALTKPWPEWMSIETAAHYCDCDKKKIRRAIKSGVLKATRPTDGYCKDGHPRIYRVDLDSWVRMGSTGLLFNEEASSVDRKAKLEALRRGSL